MSVDSKNLNSLNEDFDLIFLDPPYNENYQEIVENLLEKKYHDSSAFFGLTSKNLNKKNRYSISFLGLFQFSVEKV